MKIERGFAEIGGARINYEIAGSGQPVVLVHGFSLDLRMWAPQFSSLSGSYRVLRYDCRGFGESSPPTTDEYTHASDLKLLLQHLGLESPSLVGLSMGGQVTLEFAVTYPEIAKRLILVGPWLADFRYSNDWRQLWGRIAERNAAAGVAGAKEEWLKCDLFSHALRDSPAAADLNQMVSDYSGWHFGNLRHSPFTPVSKRLGELRIPVLILTGEHDIPDFAAIAELLHSKIPGSRKSRIAGVGHLASLEDPAAVNEAIADFLAAPPADSGG